MSTFNRNVYLTKKTTLSCMKCKRAVHEGDRFVAESEDKRGTCFKCSPFTEKEFLPSGDAAMTRRSKKHSRYCGVLLTWNKRRKRFERKGQYVEAKAIALAQKECDADAVKRKETNAKAAIKRAVIDKAYLINFAKAIREKYPKMPLNRETEIATHACEKHSGRVGRTAGAKQFDKEMIDRAVEAHIRHKETDYDLQFNKGKRKRAIRSEIKPLINQVLKSWM